MPKEPHPSYGFLTKEEFDFLNKYGVSMPSKKSIKEKIKSIKRSASARKAARTKWLKAEAEKAAKDA